MPPNPLVVPTSHLLVDRERSGVSFLLTINLVLNRFSTNREAHIDKTSHMGANFESFSRPRHDTSGVLFLHRSNRRTMYAPPCNFIIDTFGFRVFYLILLSDCALSRRDVRQCINSLGFIGFLPSQDNYYFCLQVNPRRILPPSFLPSNNVCAPLQLYYWHFRLSCLLLNFAFRLRSIASGCTTMHQQFGTYWLPPISGQLLFLSTSQPQAHSSPSFLPSNNVCASCNFIIRLLSFRFRSAYFRLLIQLYFAVATGQDPEMSNSATAHLMAIFFVQDSQGKALLYNYAPVRSSHRDPHLPGNFVRENHASHIVLSGGGFSSTCTHVLLLKTSP